MEEETLTHEQRIELLKQAIKGLNVQETLGLIEGFKMSYTLQCWDEANEGEKE